MNSLENQEILHQIEVERVENGIVKKCLQRVDSANKLIAEELKKTKGVYTKERYKEIRKFLKDESKILKSDINKDMSVEDFIEYELLAQEKLYKKYLKGSGVNFKFPTVEQMVTSATFGSYTDSSNFENYLDSLELNFFNVWDSNVREGYMTGIPTQRIVRNVVGKQAQNAQLAEAGAMKQFKNSVMANTRTALQAMANDTRRIVMEKNADLIDFYEWVGTLDRRTCIVCGNLDGKVYKDIKDFGNQPPIHFSCRCLIIPRIKGFEELEEDSTRASENGQVDSKITFNDWLKEQPEDVQKEVLGATRYELFKNSEESNKKIEFVNKNNEIIPVQKLLADYSKVESPSTQKYVNSNKFNAEEWSNSYKDKRVTNDKRGVEYMLNKMNASDELRKKIEEIETKNEKLIPTVKTYRISGKGVDSVYTKERTELHNKIIKEQLEKCTSAVANHGEQKFIMLGGRGGSGKSTLNGIVYDDKKYLVIDSDKIKELLPEYKNYNANQVHAESSDIVKKLINKAIERNYNVVLDGTLSGYNSNYEILKMFKDYGYSTELDYMFLPPQVSFERAITRFVKDGKNGLYTGRFVPLEVLVDMTENEKNFDLLKKYVDNWSFYSNYGVKKGDKPILISTSLK